MSTPPSPPTSPPAPPSSPPLPPSPPSPPAPPMLPGVIQVAGMYFVKTSGSNCGSGMITESSECEAAATALGMSDTSVSTSSSTYDSPQGCTDSSGNLYLYQYDSGSCSSTRKCICKFTPPSPPTPPPQPPSPLVPSTAYFIVYGPCTVNGTCVRSPNYPSDYGNSQSCTITPTSLAIGHLLSATAFNTESNHDKLIVNGVAYSGTTGPSDVLLGSAFTWSSDTSFDRAGWEVCAQAAPPPLPPSPPTPPSSPPMPPGYLQVAGGYYIIESGSCGGGLISTKTECDAAATALDLSDKTSSDYTSSSSSYDPPGCQLAYSSLYVYGGDSSGSCTSSKKCICMFTPPSPPTPPPLPPSPPTPPSSPPMPPGYLQIAGGYYMIESGSC